MDERIPIPRDDIRHTVSEDYSRLEAPAMLSIPGQSPYLGISQSLMYTLVDVYFENAYNASLLLQKDRFLESLAQGTVEAHLILSVCAYAAKYTLPRETSYEAQMTRS